MAALFRYRTLAPNASTVSKPPGSRNKFGKMKPSDDLQPEYEFDYTQAKPNRFAYVEQRVTYTLLSGRQMGDC